MSTMFHSLTKSIALLYFFAACSPSTSEIDISSNLVGSKIYINDKFIGVTPLTIQLALGEYDVRVEKKGFVYQDRLHIEEAYQGKKVVASFNQSHLEVNSNRAQAEVYLDGVLIGITPYKGTVEAGNHELRVIKDGNYDYQKSLVFNAFGSVSVFAKLLEHRVRIGSSYYPVIRIGKLVWMAEDLKEKTFKQDGRAMPPYYCGGSTCDEVFYTWDMAKSLAKNYRSWRLPTIEDWKYLVKYLGTKGVVKQLKPGGISGFNSRPSGFYKGAYGLVLEKGKTAYYWTSTLNGLAKNGKLGPYSFEVGHSQGHTRFFVHSPELYFSVRYVKDW